MKPVTAPSSDKLTNVKPIIQTKISQAIERAKAPNHIIVKHVVTDTYTEMMASVNRPICFDRRSTIRVINIIVTPTENENQKMIIPELASSVEIWNRSDFR